MKKVEKGTMATLSYDDDRPDRETLLANTDCRRWPGSHPVWDTKMDKPACGCPGNMVWNQDKTKCISQIDAALANANCLYPNSYPVWNPDQKQVVCDCVPGTVWNNNRSACIDSRQAALDNLDCSQYPGTIPNYDNQGNLRCACPDGVPWIRNLNRCANQQELAISSLDCSRFPGTEPVWDSQKGQAVCACKQGLVLNTAGNGCIAQQQNTMANADCSQYPGTIPVWDYKNNKPACNCPEGTQWDKTQYRCVNKSIPSPAPSYGNQCPMQNPGNNSANKFDTNNNPNDGTYIECNYWQDGSLSHQMPYRNGKRNGVSLMTKSNAHNRLEQRVEYKNDKLHGTKTIWGLEKTGHYYKLWEAHYTNGIKNSYHKWYPNGNLANKNTYRNGKPVENCYYPKNGGPGTCKQK
ncbi:MAG: hypothetical protein JEZ12_26230 [Desulfobacterium sp.]|nr:hypothetical protein [Desulfobacterium sp.]